MTANILLLDYDHTLYPSTSITLKAVDARINLFIETYLGFSPEEADSIRVKLCEEYGATLRGLEMHHGVERDNYCDFIHAIEDDALPVPDPVLQNWLESLSCPVYLFTNARKDWAERGLRAMGLESFLPESPNVPGPRFREIFDITFLDWQGKPHPDAYAKVEGHLREVHGLDDRNNGAARIWFADDKPANLLAARDRNWATIWIRPAGAPAHPSEGKFDKVVDALTDVDTSNLN